MTRRVVVTGLGVISSLGDEPRAFWHACLDGRSVVTRIPPQWRDFAACRSELWAPLTLPGFDLLFSRVERGQHDPVTLMACSTAAQALHGAGLGTPLVDRRSNTLRIEGIDAQRAGVFVGTGIGGASSFMANHAYQVLAGSRQRAQALCESLTDDDARTRAHELIERMDHVARFNPFAVSMLMPNAPAAYTGIKFGIRGHNEAVTQACASGTVAVGRAWRAIAEGRLEHALAGGSEYLDDPHGSIFQGFDACRALVRDCAVPPTANRPFDAARSGFLFAQGGAAMLLLESAEQAAARGVPALAEVVGFAESFDAHSMMNPQPGGEAMETMLRSLIGGANLQPSDVDYINAHGTGTMNNDACEADVIQRVFGDAVAVNSSKSLLGHTIGASGAIEALITVLSLHEQRLHPSLNIVDPIADLDFVTPGGRACELRFAVSQSFAFGGHNAALLLAHPDSRQG